MTDENTKSPNNDESKSPKPKEYSGSVEDLMLEVAWKDYATAADDKRALDSKINMILVANGVLLGLVLNGLSMMDKIVGYSAILVIIISSFCCILGLYLRPYKALGIMSTWKALEKNNNLENVLQAKRDIMATIDAAVKDNREQAKKIGTWLKIANGLFIIALTLIAVSLFVHYFNSVCVCNLK